MTPGALERGTGGPPANDTAMSEPRERVLYLVHRVPYPPNRGDRIRSFHVLKFLASRAEVHLAFLAEEPPPGPTMEVLQGLCRRVAAVPLGRYARWASAAWSLLAGRTATEGLFYSRELKQTVHRWAEETRFDAAFAFCSSMVQYLDAPGLAGVPAIVDLVDVDSQKWLDYAEHSRWLRRFLFRMEGYRLRRLESALPRRAAAITLVSQSEAEIYRSFCPADCVYAIPNGVDLDCFRPVESAVASRSQQCVFVGALDYRANIDGITWFCKNVWPEVRRRRPGATLRVVGSRPGAAVRRLARLPGVELVGEVRDVRPYLADAALVVVPLRVARGIQNKVLEALAMGKAVVASPQARDGLDMQPDIHLSQATTPAEWADAVARLLDNEGLRRRLGLAGRKLVEAGYAWEARLPAWESPWARVAASRQRPSQAGHTAVTASAYGPR